MYLSNGGEPIPDGGGSPSFFCFQKNVDNRFCEFKNIDIFKEKRVQCTKFYNINNRQYIDYIKLR